MNSQLINTEQLVVTWDCLCDTGHRATVSFSSDESSDDELKVPERSLRKSDDSRGLFSAIRTQTNSSSEDEEAYTQCEFTSYNINM